jgi:hypothetical protein
MQPEGKTGRSFIKPGGAPALAPKGETPAGMQAAPRGSSKTIETDKIRNRGRHCKELTIKSGVIWSAIGGSDLSVCSHAQFILHQLVHHPSF